ncbi:MAG TPA: hypothetical protein VK212_01705 [Lentimicrobium sp.]|nr:hypothetical protein [Lentimicrobium sp.]
MKTSIITEFVKFRVLNAITEEQLIIKADALNDFQAQQEGFIDAELVRDIQDDKSWSLVYHFEDLDKVKAIGAKLRSSQVFTDFTSLAEPGSLSVGMNQQYRNW